MVTVANSQAALDRMADADAAAAVAAAAARAEELAPAIVQANDDDHSASNPAPYYHEDRPGKTGDIEFTKLVKMVLSLVLLEMVMSSY